MMRLFFLTGDGILGALAGTHAATGAGLFIDFIIVKVFANTGSTFLVFDMGIVLIAKIIDGRHHRIGSRRPQAAKGGLGDHIAQLLEELDITLFAVAFADGGQNLQHALDAFPAGITLSTGFLF